MLVKQRDNIKIDESVAKKARIAIIITSYHKALIQNLQEYCIKTLIKHKVKESNIKVFTAPGSWEIPLLAKVAAKSKKFDAIITFGIIVKGQTYHFEMIANECARALMQISLEFDIPIALEVLAVFDLKQAKMRAGKNTKNKGIEGAIAVLEMISELNN